MASKDAVNLQHFNVSGDYASDVSFFVGSFLGSNFSINIGSCHSLDIGASVDVVLGLPLLRKVGWLMKVSGNITQLNMPLLDTIGDSLNVADTAMQTFEAPKLLSIAAGLSITNNSALETVSFPHLAQFAGSLNVVRNPVLQNLSLPILQSIDVSTSPYCLQPGPCCAIIGNFSRYAQHLSVPIYILS